MSSIVGIMLAFGLVCLVHGYRVRAGKSRSFYPSYRTDVWYRNGPFALLPFGLWLLAGSGAILASNEAVVGLFAMIGFVVLALSLVWLFRPAELIKPRWLREVEAGRAAEPQPTAVYGTRSPSGARRLYLPPPVYWGGWIATAVAVVLVLWLAFGWPWSVLVGIGGAVSVLAAHTPKKA
jgi:hypothetical protein